MSLDDITVLFGNEVLSMDTVLQSLDFSQSNSFVFHYPPNVLLGDSNTL